MYRNKIICEDCGQQITTNNIDKHKNSKACKKYQSGYRIKHYEQIEILICKFCNKECKNGNSLINHERLCPQNVNRIYKNGMTGKKGKNQYIKAKELNLPKPEISEETRNKFVENGKRKHSEITKTKLSIIACNRLMKHSKYSKNTEYKPGIFLESSYEVRCAKILDELNVKWIKVRKGFEYDCNGFIKRYIPDFYLPEYNIYLDPKNDFLIKKDKNKIESASEKNNISVIVLSNKEINIEHFRIMFNMLL